MYLQFVFPIWFQVFHLPSHYAPPTEADSPLPGHQSS